MSGPTVEKCKAKVDLVFQSVGFQRGRKFVLKFFIPSNLHIHVDTPRIKLEVTNFRMMREKRYTIFGVPLKYQDIQAIRRT